jgi:uncharacterized repeat protein (TIGR01451 family)
MIKPMRLHIGGATMNIIPQHHARRFHHYVVALFGLLILSLVPAIVVAVEVPPKGSTFFVQTNGPTDPISDGDWFGSNANGVGAGYHYFEVNIPCGWPAARPIYFDLFSPMIHDTNNGTDEPGIIGLLSTVFELYGLNTTVRPTTSTPNQPGPGATGSLVAQTFAPSANSEQWYRFYTLTVPTCGKYLLRAETRGADQNGWRLRVGWDSDSDPNNAENPNYDNPDGLLGTNDEIAIGILQAAYQQDSGLTQCLTLYQYVAPYQASISFHNFDGDWDYICGNSLANCRIRYYAPSDLFDANAHNGGMLGTVSGNTQWNTGTTTNRGTGDVVTRPEAGWWRIVSCISHHNQFIQEGQTSQSLFYSAPAFPKMNLANTDLRTSTAPNVVMTYTLTFTNTSNTTSTPGAATDIRITDTLDSRVKFQACGYEAPYSGTCNLVGGNIVFAPSNWVNAGETFKVWVRIQTEPSVTSGGVTNVALLTYRDSLGQLFPNVVANDIDSARPTAVVLSHFDALVNSSVTEYVMWGALGAMMFAIVVWARGRPIPK